MKKQVILQMFKGGELVAEHDVTTHNFLELLILVGIQRELGRTSSIKVQEEATYQQAKSPTGPGNSL